MDDVDLFSVVIGCFKLSSFLTVSDVSLSFIFDDSFIVSFFNKEQLIESLSKSILIFISLHK